MPIAEPMSEKCFFEVLQLVHELTGITIAANRTSMVEGRIRKRLSALRLSGYEDYLRLIRNDKAEQTRFIDAITTNETYFFRTPRIWDFIEKRFIPSWFERNPGKTFCAWSAAAASGEEAHSLAVVCEAFREKNRGFQYQVFGSDISQEMVRLCSEGLYSGKSIDAFRRTRPELFKRFMQTKDEVHFQVRNELHARLRFFNHNLFRPMPLRDTFDLVLIRNVLIYFKPSDQEQVLATIAPRVNSQGAVIIGESESLAHIRTSFHHVEPLIYSPAPDLAAQTASTAALPKVS